MKLELGWIALAFFGGMVAQDQMAADDVVWVDYGENPMENPKFMEAWQAAATPGAEHKRMAAMAGDWVVDSSMWMAPGAPPMTSKGTSTCQMVLGGRYLIENYKSEFMGEAFEGMLIQGYDNLQKRNFNIWIDNLSTWPTIAMGQTNDKGVSEMGGVMYDLSTPAGRPFRQVIDASRVDATKFEMFDSTPDGSEFRMMQMDYKRKGAK